MNDESPPEGHYGLQEANEKLVELIESRGRVWLLAVATRLVGRHGEAEDLIQEAFERTLSGRRRWPRGVSAATFLAQTMRSIACDWNERAGRMDVRAPDEGLPSLAATPAEIMEAVSEERFLLQSLEDDPELHALAEGLCADWDKSDLLALFDGNQTRYDTTRRRLRRRTDAISRTGGPHAKNPPREDDTPA